MYMYLVLIKAHKNTMFSQTSENKYYNYNRTIQKMDTAGNLFRQFLLTNCFITMCTATIAIMFTAISILQTPEI
jgi:hypothetical protein